MHRSKEAVCRTHGRNGDGDVTRRMLVDSVELIKHWCMYCRISVNWLKNVWNAQQCNIISLLCTAQWRLLLSIRGHPQVAHVLAAKGQCLVASIAPCCAYLRSQPWSLLRSDLVNELCETCNLQELPLGLVTIPGDDEFCEYGNTQAARKQCKKTRKETRAIKSTWILNLCTQTSNFRRTLQARLDQLRQFGQVPGLSWEAARAERHATRMQCMWIFICTIYLCEPRSKYDWFLTMPFM